MNPRKTHCKKGHRYTSMTTTWCILKNGYVVRHCRICRSAYDKKRYSDPRFHEKMKTRSREYHRRMRAEQRKLKQQGGVACHEPDATNQMYCFES